MKLKGKTLQYEILFYMNLVWLKNFNTLETYLSEPTLWSFLAERLSLAEIDHNQPKLNTLLNTDI